MLPPAARDAGFPRRARLGRRPTMERDGLSGPRQEAPMRIVRELGSVLTAMVLMGVAFVPALLIPYLS